MNTNFPEWLYRSDCPPAEIREKLRAMVEATAPHPEKFIDNVCLIAHCYACAERDRCRYRDVYNAQKRRPKSKPRPGTQQAGDELQAFRDAAMELHNFLWDIRPHGRRALIKELGVSREDISAMLAAWDEAAERAQAKVGRGAPSRGLPELVGDAGREYREALGRVPTKPELQSVLTTIFGREIGAGEVGRWITKANATPWESEKPENR